MRWPRDGAWAESVIIATFNINGIKARMPALLDWLGERRPDVALLQEIKSLDDAFPSEPIEDLGYQVETHGQKGFNGVAICSRLPIEDVKRGLPGDPDDEQARWMEASVSGEKGAVSVCCLYLPNGNPAPGPKFDYKLAWMERMKRRAEALLELEEPLVMAGDYNVIQQPEDCWDETEWAEDALYMMETRTAFREILNLGFTDALNVRDGSSGNYTFWDYQAGRWKRNHGIRIDHMLLSPQAADKLVDCQVDKHVRGEIKPSDHVPVWVELDA